MIKSILKYFIYIVFFIYILIAFLPKENLYFLGLEKLKNENIVMISNKIEDNYFSFVIKDSIINYEDITVSNIENISLYSSLFLTKVNIKDIKVNDALKHFVPEYITNIELTHSVIDIFRMKINATFQKGRAFGYIDLLHNKIVIKIDVPQSFIHQYKELSKKFKKEGKYYIYELQY